MCEVVGKMSNKGTFMNMIVGKDNKKPLEVKLIALEVLITI